VSNDGFVYAIDQSSGILIWSYQTENFVRSSPAIAAGMLFVGSDDGYLYALGPGKETFLSMEVLLPLVIVVVVIAVVMVLLLTRFRRKRENRKHQISN
jgi:hypothetical protein